MIYAHENANQHVAVDLKWDEPVALLYQEFHKQRIGSTRALADRSIELRFVYMGSSANLLTPESAVLTSVRPSGKCKRPDSATHGLSSRIPQSKKPILRSAFIPPPTPTSTLSLSALERTWSRTPPMASYQFTRITAQIQESGAIRLIRTLDQEPTIQTATDWIDGETNFNGGKMPYSHTGFIGMGSSKRGIYVNSIPLYSFTF